MPRDTPKRSRRLTQFAPTHPPAPFPQYGVGHMWATVVTLSYFGAYYAIWNAEEHASWLKPGSGKFFVVGFLFFAIHGTMLAVRSDLLVHPPSDDEVFETYKHPVQPVPIALDFVQKILLEIFFVSMIMFKGHRDPSPHVRTSGHAVTRKLLH